MSGEIKEDVFNVLPIYGAILVGSLIVGAASFAVGQFEGWLIAFIIALYFLFLIAIALIVFLFVTKGPND